MPTAQVSRSIPSPRSLSRQRSRPRQVIAATRVGLVAAAMALAAAGCASAGTSPVPTSGTTSLATAREATLLPTASQSGRPDATGTPLSGSTALADIPPGREIAEGGGGPKSYTFREEWRRARSVAQEWRSGAYLVSGVGSFVNDDGVPSSWTFDFVDRVSPDAVLVVEIDPWGKVTATREITGTGASSLVGPNAGRIPYAVIDSDTAVGIAKVPMDSRYDLTKTRDPRIALGFSVLDGSGPYWTYTVFHEPSAAYVSARIDALTGAVTLTD